VASILIRRARALARSPRARTVALVASLACTLGIVGALGYEAWQSGRAQREGAERALHAYARFAALTYRQRVQARLYTAIVGVIRTIADPRTSQPMGPLPDVEELRVLGDGAVRCRCGPALEPSFYFRVEIATRVVTTAGGPVSSVTREMLAGLPDSLDPLASSTTWDYATVSDVSGPAPRVAVIALRRGPDGAPRAIYGFTVSTVALEEGVFRPAVTAGPLLLFTPAESVPNDSVLSVVLRDSVHARFVATPRRYRGPYSESVPFAGIAGITAIDVALNPSVTPALLVGGVPASRLPLLVTLLALCALLLTATIVFAWRAMELARVRSDFVANVSHELRTPLAQVLLFSETLSLGRMTTRREVRRAADIIVGETRRLMQLVDNVLMFGRHERSVSASATEPVQLAPVVRDVLAAFIPLAAAAEVTMRTARLDPCAAAIDRAELRQLLLNLLDNAVKYGPRGQTVTIGLAQVGTAGEPRVRIWVEDEGPGIPEADRVRVWEPFVRLTRDIESETAGSGIGLSVAHQIVVRHGGTARVEAAPGGGACVVAEFPAIVTEASSIAIETGLGQLRQVGSADAR